MTETGSALNERVAQAMELLDQRSFDQLTDFSDGSAGCEVNAPLPVVPGSQFEPKIEQEGSGRLVERAIAAFEYERRRVVSLQHALLDAQKKLSGLMEQYGAASEQLEALKKAHTDLQKSHRTVKSWADELYRVRKEWHEPHIERLEHRIRELEGA